MKVMQKAVAKQHWCTDPHSWLDTSSLIEKFGTKGHKYQKTKYLNHSLDPHKNALLGHPILFQFCQFTGYDL